MGAALRAWLACARAPPDPLQGGHAAAAGHAAAVVTNRGRHRAATHARDLEHAYGAGKRPLRGRRTIYSRKASSRTARANSFTTSGGDFR